MSEIEFSSIESGLQAPASTEVASEDLIRVSEQLVESRKYRGMIQSRSLSNTKIAQFLYYIVMAIDKESFRETVSCFSVRQGIGEPLFLSHLFCFCLAPVYREKADNLGLASEVGIDYHIDMMISDYATYLRALVARDELAQYMHPAQFVVFVKEVALIANIADAESVDETLLFPDTIAG